MIRNVTYKDKEVTKEIDLAVGRAFSFWEAIKMKGTGSQQLLITQCSPELEGLLKLDKYRNTCNIELRGKGVIIRFRSRLETFAWVLPYAKLSLEVSEKSVSIYSGENFIIAQHAFSYALDSKFFTKLNLLKSQ
ncbi:hypothetical protein R9C00_20340 [Flammeovirgaceae bacterium SG7u.111]|nr:hypothetical protein [Flammeovirgaceae bacterium SG7u.132]WPO34052.1 hypothetical protein R9C00_20340 [Flammeovirgaceae bacterium SG7u.111]